MQNRQPSAFHQLGVLCFHRVKMLFTPPGAKPGKLTECPGVVIRTTEDRILILVTNPATGRTAEKWVQSVRLKKVRA